MEKETCTFSYCKKPEVTEVDCDLLIMGGGMAGCGAAYEACRWANAKSLKVVLVDKAATDRSGAVAMGLSAINTYVGENKCADYVKYVRNDLMGIIREDLVLTSADTLTIRSSFLKNGDSRSGKRVMTDSQWMAIRQKKPGKNL
jgi:succinate dehydrogenase/fumarate reductase flavoprotein subunit